MATLFGCHGNIPWQIGKYGTDSSSAHKALSYGEKVAKIGPVHPEIFNEIRQITTWIPNAIFISLFSTETTGLIFTKILHDIATLVALFNHAYTRRYPIPFLNARATNVRSLPFFSQNRLPWQRPLRYRKRGPDRSSAPKRLSFGEKIVKIGLVHLEIFDKIRRTRREHATQFNFHLLSCSLPKLLDQSSPKFYTIGYSVTSAAIKSCIYKSLVHSISERHSNEWRWSILTLQNVPKLIGYHSNIPWATTKLMSVL